MLASIRDFFTMALAEDAPGGERHTLELATAALLVEVIRMDGEATTDERDTTLRAVREKFALAPGQAQQLIDLAEAEARQATDYYQFTSIINRRFTQPQKIRVVELMWEVAYADKVASPIEEHLIRKIADLLYVEHRDFITAKLAARDAAGAAPN